VVYLVNLKVSWIAILFIIKGLFVFRVHAFTLEQNRQALNWMESNQIQVRKYISRVSYLAVIENGFKELKKRFSSENYH